MAKHLILTVAILVCAQLAKGETPAEIKFNDRGFACEAFDFAELNSLDAAELANIHCSAYAGGLFTFTRVERIPTSDVYGTSIANKDALRKSDACMKIIKTTRDIAARKFTTLKFGCNDYMSKAKKMAYEMP